MSVHLHLPRHQDRQHRRDKILHQSGDVPDATPYATGHTLTVLVGGDDHKGLGEGHAVEEEFLGEDNHVEEDEDHGRVGEVAEAVGDVGAEEA